MGWLEGDVAAIDASGAAVHSFLPPIFCCHLPWIASQGRQNLNHFGLTINHFRGLTMVFWGDGKNHGFVGGGGGVVGASEGTWSVNCFGVKIV